MSYQIMGRCSKCNGNVVMPHVYHSVVPPVPPVPTCQACGATKKDDRPVIEMEGGWATIPDTRSLLNEINVKT